MLPLAGAGEGETAAVAGDASGDGEGLGDGEGDGEGDSTAVSLVAPVVLVVGAGLGLVAFTLSTPAVHKWQQTPNTSTSATQQSGAVSEATSAVDLASTGRQCATS